MKLNLKIHLTQCQSGITDAKQHSLWFTQ